VARQRLDRGSYIDAKFCFGPPRKLQVIFQRRQVVGKAHMLLGQSQASSMNDPKKPDGKGSGTLEPTNATVHDPQRFLNRIFHIARRAAGSSRVPAYVGLRHFEQRQDGVSVPAYCRFHCARG